PLTLAAAVTGAVLCACVFARGPVELWVPCWLSLWVLYLTFSLYAVTLCMRILRLVAVYRLREASAASVERRIIGESLIHGGGTAGRSGEQPGSTASTEWPITPSRSAGTVDERTINGDQKTKPWSPGRESTDPIRSWPDRSTVPTTTPASSTQISQDRS